MILRKYRRLKVRLAEAEAKLEASENLLRNEASLTDEAIRIYFVLKGIPIPPYRFGADGSRLLHSFKYHVDGLVDKAKADADRKRIEGIVRDYLSQDAKSKKVDKPKDPDYGHGGGFGC